MPIINDDNVIARVLDQSKVIAVVGMSTDHSRDSYQIARYLQDHGYRIIPVNPTYSGETILGERCHASLLALASRQVWRTGASRLAIHGRRIRERAPFSK